MIYTSIWFWRTISWGRISCSSKPYRGIYHGCNLSPWISPYNKTRLVIYQLALREFALIFSYMRPIYLEPSCGILFCRKEKQILPHVLTFSDTATELLLYGNQINAWCIMYRGKNIFPTLPWLLARLASLPKSFYLFIYLYLHSWQSKGLRPSKVVR